jgi:hypothetical protein
MRRLALRRETVRTLAEVDLTRVNGGDQTVPNCTMGSCTDPSGWNCSAGCGEDITFHYTCCGTREGYVE